MQLWVKSIHHWQCDTCQQWSIGIQATCQESQRRLFAYAMISSGNQRSLFSTLSQVMSVSLIRPLNLRAILDSTGGSWMVHVERKPMLDAGRCWKNRIEIIKSSRCREHLEDLEQCFSGTPNCKAQKLKHSFVPWELLVLSVGKLKMSYVCNMEALPNCNEAGEDSMFITLFRICNIEVDS